MSVKQYYDSKKILVHTQQRVTANRKLLLDLIHASPGHFDADEIYRKAREENSTISLSTVYRNLQLFKKLGIVEERHFSQDHHHYEKKQTADHQHFQCTRCGKIIELSWPLLPKSKKIVSERYGFQITGVEIELTGLCFECGKMQEAGL
ncbi:MAG TPA: hypothetical protein DCX22_02450 [Dehalococcoidia bacterium]|nr:hypothetical protein [Dehalococcoidia bacterium]